MSELEPRHAPVLQAVDSEAPGFQDVEQERDRRYRLFRTIALVSAAGTVPVCILFIIQGFQNPDFFRYMVPVCVGFIACDLVAFWLSKRGGGDLPIAIYMVSLTAVATMLMHFTGGYAGPMAFVLISIPVLAGVLAGARTVRWLVVLIVAIYGLRIFLDRAGILVAPDISEDLRRWLYLVVFLAVVLSVAFIIIAFNGLIRSALDTAQRRGRELNEASRQARLAAEAERSARQREERTAQQLRLAVQQFAAFLEQVSAGDYGARLNLEAFDPNEPGMQGLYNLGRDLNATVDILVGTLTDMQTVQRRYTSEAWAEFARSEGVAAEFEYRGGRVITRRRAQGAGVPGPGRASSAASWRAATEQSVQSQQLVVQGNELALPILLNGAVIGVLGARRASPAGDQEALRQGQPVWSEDELTVIQLAADQLAQTIENLRLLDVTRRSAARERTLGHVTGQIRQELDLERLLQTAVDQIQDAMNLEKVTVRLTSGSELDITGQASTPVDRQD